MAFSSAPPEPRRFLDRLLGLLAIADDPLDDEDIRRRKRVGVFAGYLTVLVPYSLPFQGAQLALSWPLAIGLSAYSAVSLVVLARTRRFDRFVVLLIASGVVFVPAASVVGGGITGSTGGLVWGFLIPAYAILALGPRRATRWFVVYLAVVAVMVAIDPFARESVPQPSVALRVIGHVENAVIPLTVVFALLRYTDTRRLAAEARVDELLTNAIPATIAARLRRGERRIADAYPSTTILFADIVGFTPWAQRTPPDEVVALLDDLFTRFDALTEEHGLEKVKTIGDAYMAVAGAPDPQLDHARSAVALGRAMIDAIRDVRQVSGIPLEIRVGIASGPAVGGVIGSRRLLFDLWGDTVNVASRMESSGVAGRIHVAGSTRDLLADDATRFERREVEVKGLGPMTTYLLSEEHATADG
ncbi:MAG: adenylate/guanylate cyclase domain-containing protein [Chloroflexi bacterium]|nr:adenylate/guanylate cyclase domain-containing protein [Chloroflexota bacterium]